MKKSLLLAFGLLLFKMQFAQTVTWADNIAPIMYANCTSCHHQGGLAPIALTTYTDAYTNRFNMLSDITNGKMPPWPPDRKYTHLKDERFLSDDQINLITTWVSNGAPEGNAANTPIAPVYNNTTQLSSIDLMLQIPTYTVPNTNTDLYRCFTLPTGLGLDQFITAIEILPGNPSIVHHVLIYEDTTSNQESVVLDNADPGAGYTNFGGPGFNADLVAGWVPGTRPEVYPSGMGVPIHAHSRLVLQIHYPAGSAGKTDSTKINLKLSTASLRPITIIPPLDHDFSMVNGPLVVPANTVKTFEESYTIPNYPIAGVSLLNVAPHAHLICKNWLAFGTTPSGDTVPFIKIDNWDFHWQGFYSFQKLKFFPVGGTFHGFATYDNTTNNPNNPNSPPQLVHVGESTNDEMMLCYFSYLIYQPGDENFIVDSTLLNNPTGIHDLPQSGIVSTVQLYDAMPNPAKDQTSITYFLPESTKTEFKVYDLTGRLVDEVNVPNTTGFNTVQYNTSKLSSGTYLYSLITNGSIKSKQLVVTK